MAVRHCSADGIDRLAGDRGRLGMPADPPRQHEEHGCTIFAAEPEIYGKRRDSQAAAGQIQTAE